MNSNTTEVDNEYRTLQFCILTAQGSLHTLSQDDELRKMVRDGNLIFPKSSNNFSFTFSVVSNDRRLNINCSFPPFLTGNRYIEDNISINNPPSCVQFTISVCPFEQESLLRNKIHSYATDGKITFWLKKK